MVKLITPVQGADDEERNISSIQNDEPNGDKKTDDEGNIIDDDANNGDDGGDDGGGGDNNSSGDNDDKPISIEGLEKIEIDGKINYISEDGFLVDEEGNKSYTKEEFDAIRLQSDSIDIDLLNENDDLKIVDEEGNPIQFENTIEGLIKRETTLKEISYNKGVKDGISSIFDNDPVLKKAYEHYKETGTFDNFKQAVDYTKVTLAESDEDALEAIIRDAEAKKGNKPDKIDRLIEFYKSDNKLFDEAKDAKEFLIDAQRKEEENERISKENIAKQEKEKLVSFLGFDIDENGKEVIINNEGSVYNKIVDKGQIGNIRIPESGILIKNEKGEKKVIKRRDIFNYIALAANDKGYSQAELDEMKAMSNIDVRLTRFLYNLTGGDMTSLIAQSKVTKDVNQIRTYKSNTSKPKSTSNSNIKNVKLKTPVD